ncbi:MAG TPA: mannosyltransferase family protein [Baekduia sp.]|nr:mannosyltransferase family protein [Baekduia sp.]
MGKHANPTAGWGPHLRAAWQALWVSRVLIWSAGLGAVGLWGVSRRQGDFDMPGLTRPFGSVGDALVAPAARWDSYWFLEIARDGYDSVRAAFFPLYPLLIAPGRVFGERGMLLLGVAVSVACFFVALTVLHRLTEIELGADAARWTVLALALFPMSFFFTAVYSESLFLMVSVGAVYFARTDRWAAAGLLGALGAATRSAGVVLVIALVLMWWQQSGRRARDLAWICVVPLGLVVFCAGLALVGEDYNAPFRAQDTWMRDFSMPFGAVSDGAVAAWDGLRQLLSGSNTPVYFEKAGDPLRSARHNVELFGYLLIAIPALIGAARRLPAAYAGYALAALALPLSYPVEPQPLMSLPRFEIVLFPLFMWLGLWLSQGGNGRRTLVLGTFSVLLVISVARFATWHWVA